MFDELIKKLASYESLSARTMYNWTTLSHRFHRQLSASAFEQVIAVFVNEISSTCLMIMAGTSCGIDPCRRDAEAADCNS